MISPGRKEFYLPNINKTPTKTKSKKRSTCSQMKPVIPCLRTVVSDDNVFCKMTANAFASKPDILKNYKSKRSRTVQALFPVKLLLRPYFTEHIFPQNARATFKFTGNAPFHLRMSRVSTFRSQASVLMISPNRTI